MGRRLRSVRGLQWRLTLAYTLLTVVTVVAVELIVLIATDRPASRIAPDALHAALLVVLLSAVVGMVSGFAVARWLAGRLSILTVAADAWSRGDLATRAVDRSNDELGQLAHRLNRMAEQLQSLLRMREELAVVEERQRLARDLHDAVKQQVFALRMQVAAASALTPADQVTVRGHLSEAERLSGEVQSELGHIINALGPPALETQGLAAALRQLVREWAARTGVRVELAVEDPGAVSEDASQALYRVAQEALTNIARHSGATSAVVTLSRADGRLLLRIDDDGSGFDPFAGRDGFGIRGIRARVHALGGSVDLRSNPGGTRVMVWVPAATATVLPAGEHRR